MKIGIEAQRVFRTGKHGMDVVALELMKKIQQKDKTNDYYLFAARGPDSGCIAETENFRKKVLRGLTYADREQVFLPAAVKKYRLDLIHCTANTAPLNGRVPLVLTLHDIIYLEETSLKGSAYQSFGNLYRKFIVPHAIRKAASIITVSDYEKKIIGEYFPQAAAKISVVHNGVDERFHHKYSSEEIGLFRKRYSLPERFILFLGNTAPKKNTLNVIKAYSHYHDSTDDPLPIVVADYERKYVERALSGIKKSRLISSFILPGYIPTDTMPLLYNCSTLFLYPSLRESFGIPIIEAMACGVPVITSANSAMPETAGAAAAFIDPENPEAIAERMITILNDGELQTSLRNKGLERASYFSWENSADQILKIYESFS